MFRQIIPQGARCKETRANGTQAAIALPAISLGQVARTPIHKVRTAGQPSRKENNLNGLVSAAGQ